MSAAITNPTSSQFTNCSSTSWFYPDAVQLPGAERGDKRLKRAERHQRDESNFNALDPLTPRARGESLRESRPSAARPGDFEVGAGRLYIKGPIKVPVKLAVKAASGGPVSVRLPSALLSLSQLHTADTSDKDPLLNLPARLPVYLDSAPPSPCDSWVNLAEPLEAGEPAGEARAEAASCSQGPVDVNRDSGHTGEPARQGRRGGGDLAGTVSRTLPPSFRWDSLRKGNWKSFYCFLFIVLRLCSEEEEEDKQQALV
ncbi:unnamed protein product [Pleuronectes platessa]|uniref:Uncharacterized protein n=1 Tax=Pleuronectes platessa TaxID=8262 RepID=A0A9N7Z5P4_PLEPL|nr:unnamed protein product [Pleuronectes platessa]